MDALLPIFSFALASTITPGPNNLMLAASGVAFGFRRTVPHMLGIPAGFTVLVVICGLGVGTVVRTVPSAALALKLLGTAYLLYLTWAMRHAFITVADSPLRGRPLRFVEAGLFQLANPKAWLVSLTAVSLFVAGEQWYRELVTLWAVFVAVIVPSLLVWVGLGVTARRSFVGGRARPLFSAAIVALMIYTIVGIWIQEVP